MDPTSPSPGHFKDVSLHPASGVTIVGLTLARRSNLVIAERADVLAAYPVADAPTYGKSARRPKHNSSRCYVNCDLDALRVETVAARQGPYVGRDVGRAGRCQLKGLEADGTLIAGPLVERHPPTA